MKRKEIEYSEFENALSIVKAFRRQQLLKASKIYAGISDLGKFPLVSKETRLSEVEGLTVRTLNCLKEHEVEFIKDLEDLSFKKLKLTRNLGKISLLEIKELCYSAGIILKP